MAKKPPPVTDIRDVQVIKHDRSFMLSDRTGDVPQDNTSALGLYLMRLVSVAITSAFLASALMSAFSWRRSRMLVLGAGVAIVPTVIYLGAVLNDSGLEIAPAICLWVSLLVFVLDPPAEGGARLLTRAGVAACALALARPLSPLWLVLIAVTVLALVGRQRLRALLRRRDVQAWIAAAIVCTGLALLWTTSVGVAVVGRRWCTANRPRGTRSDRTAPIGGRWDRCCWKYSPCSRGNFHSSTGRSHCSSTPSSRG